MKRAVLILVVGLFAAVAGYCTLFYCGTREHRQMLESSAPELAWLKKEFQLGDAEFERIAKLHEGYLPRCAELCRRIAAKNSELQQIVAGTNVDAKAVEQKLKEAGDLRVECQKNMFNHFLEVSRQMPPEQGKRYLQWVQQRTLAPEHDMAQRHGTDQKMEHH
jgi:Spy/CpxP family protein refolding chaperone